VIHRVGSRRSHPRTAIPTPPRPLALDACYRYCEALAHARSHNFPVASRFAPAHLRKHIFAIYAFARTADDFADEPAFAGRRARELDRWEEQLYTCFHDAERGVVPEQCAADHPIFVALCDTVQRFELPITTFTALLAGFRMDLDVRQYATHGDLRAYTALAAEPIGHLFLYLSGYRDPLLLRSAEDLASALALAHFWQDLAADLDRGRLYVPVEDLRQFGISEAALRQRRAAPAALTALVRYEVSYTRALLERSRFMIEQIGDDLAVEMALIWLGGARILDKIERAGAGVLSRRPRLDALDKARVVGQALAWRGRSLARRVRP
jgi:squalene synthase HpnC